MTAAYYVVLAYMAWTLPAAVVMALPAPPTDPRLLLADRDDRV